MHVIVLRVDQHLIVLQIGRTMVFVQVDSVNIRWMLDLSPCWRWECNRVLDRNSMFRIHASICGDPLINIKCWISNIQKVQLRMHGGWRWRKPSGLRHLKDVLETWNVKIWDAEQLYSLDCQYAQIRTVQSINIINFFMRKSEKIQFKLKSIWNLKFKFNVQITVQSKWCTVWLSRCFSR